MTASMKENTVDNQKNAQDWLKAAGVDCSEAELRRSVAKLVELAAGRGKDDPALKDDPAFQRVAYRVERLGEALGIAVEGYFEAEPPLAASSLKTPSSEPGAETPAA